MNLIDPILQRRFDNKGYVVIDFLEQSEIDILKKIYADFPANKVADFQVSNYEKNPKKNRKIDLAIKNVIADKISLFIKDYKLLTGFFYVKFTGESSAFYIHKDWNIVDESKYTSMHIWIPLSDTTIKNGNLFFCPYDYKKGLTYRGSPGFEFPKPSRLTEIINRFYKKDIFTKCGQAVIFDHKLTHGSNPNVTDEIRVVAGISIIPSNSSLIHYCQDLSGKITAKSVSDDFYLDFDLNGSSDKNDYQKQSNELS